MALHFFSQRKRILGSPAFTLIEMVVVIIIVTIIYSFAAPTLSRYNIRKKLQFESQKVASVLELARSTATTEHRPIKVEFNTSTQEFYYLDASQTGPTQHLDKLYRLDSGISFNSAPSSLTFSISGGLQGNANVTIIIQGAAGKRVDIAINGRTGRVIAGNIY